MHNRNGKQDHKIQTILGISNQYEHILIFQPSKVIWRSSIEMGNYAFLFHIYATLWY